MHGNMSLIDFSIISQGLDVREPVKTNQQKVDRVVHVQIDPWYLRITFDVDNLLQQAGAFFPNIDPWPPG